MKQLFLTIFIYLSSFCFAKDTTSVKPQGNSEPNKKEMSNYERWVLFSAFCSVLISTATAFFVFHTLKAAKDQIQAQHEVLRLGKNIDITMELHNLFSKTKGDDLLRFHNTNKDQILACNIHSLDEFVYVLNSLLASEFYYDHYSSWESILKDFSLYRMNFLIQPSIKQLWHTVIKENWTMAKKYEIAVEEFYNNPNFYIENYKRSNG